jgi:hypothetical protein
MEIKLSNALKATFYDKNPPQAEKVLKLCDIAAKNRGVGLARWGTECVLKLRVEQELLYIVLSIDPHTAQKVRKILRNGGIASLLRNVTYVIYHKTAHWWDNETGEALLDSIKENVAPSIYVLTHGKKQKMPAL